jgi:ribosomal protein S12 methylthiotransferase accessory factor
MSALGTRCCVEDILIGLRKSEKIVYTENGNRALTSAQILRRIISVLPKVGLTRLANISRLTPGSFPVYQSSRPDIFSHSFTGQNTGAQGKGLSKIQAKISCIMETIESYCMEPRNEILIRGSYEYLSKQHVMLPPWIFPLQRGAAKPLATEPFMWTESLVLGGHQPVLVPAECVYFPFFPRDFATRPAFISTSNGVAAGATYLEATIHALYELIERHYFGLWEHGKIRAHAFISEELDCVPQIQKFRKSIMGMFSMEILALRLAGIRNLPTFACWLLRQDGPWLFGSGCAANFDIAIHRAVSEAIQADAVLVSGTREDCGADEPISSYNHFPRYQTLSRKSFAKTSYDKYFDDLQDEFQFAKSWLEKAGFPIVAIANLSRIGVGVPVVKAIVPGLCEHVKRNYGLNCTTADVHARCFGYSCDLL